MVILSSPSGAGKTTLVKLLSESRDFYTSISHTTRKPRNNEEEGKDYYFVNNDQFQNLIKKNKKIAIFGVGGVGHMAILFAKIEGCEVSGVSRKEKHLKVAKKIGADNIFTYSSSQEQFLQDLNEKYGLFDAAIVFAPVDQVTDTAIKSIKKGGTVVIATVGKIPNFLAFEEKTIRGTLIGSRKDMEDVIKISDEHKLEVVTESFPLEQANEVLIRLKNSEIDARAVLIP